MNESKHNTLFLIELIFSIFFFIICACVCVQVFSKAHILTKRSQNTNETLMLCQEFSSLFYADTSFATTKNYYSSNDHSLDLPNFDMQSTVLLYYDRNWKLTDVDQSFYYALLTHENNEGFSIENMLIGNREDLATIQVPDDLSSLENSKDTFRHLSIKKYLGNH